MNCYSIHDGAANCFLPPFFARTDNQAQRMFVGSLGDSFPYRVDFTLHRLGVFDDETGQLTGHDNPILIVSGLSIPESMDPRFAVTTQETAA